MGGKVSPVPSIEFRNDADEVEVAGDNSTERRGLGSSSSDPAGNETDRLIALLVELDASLANTEIPWTGGVGGVLVSNRPFNNDRLLRWDIRPALDGGGDISLVSDNSTDKPNGTSVSGSDGNIRQQIGEILGTVRGLDERVRERHREAKEEWILISARVEKVERQNRELASKMESIKFQLGSITSDIDAMEKPVGEFVNMKRRIVAGVALVASAITVLWAILEPSLVALARRIFS